MDLLEGYKSRKARIGKAALENCVEEQEAMSDCYRHGGWKDQMTMCRKQNKAFERCYTMQAVSVPTLFTFSYPSHEGNRFNDKIQRFLKALGYLSAYDRPADIDEQIQMHADTLYHQMLDHEAAVAKAKASDTPVPEFPPLISPSSTLRSSDHTTQQQQQQQQPPTTATGQPISSSAAATLDGARSLSYEESTAQYLQRLKPSVREGLQAEWEKKKLSKEEKMLAARAYAMEAEAGIGVANQVGKLMEETRQRREERRKEGTATLGDWVSGLLGR